MLASLTVMALPWYDPLRDGSIYIGLSRSLLAGDGYSYLGIPFSVRPPGFPVLIAPVLAIWGTDFHVLNLFMGSFGILALAFLYLYQRPRLGGGLALLCCAALWLNPGYQRFCNVVMSDIPGFAAFMLCLLVERWATCRASWKRELVLGVCVGLSAYLRSIFILLAPAIALARILNRGASHEERAGWGRFFAKRLVPFSLVAVLLLMPWSIRNRQSIALPPADQFSLYSYSTAMWHTNVGDPDSAKQGPIEILARIPTRARQMAEVAGSRLKSRVQGVNAPEYGLEPVHGAISLFFLFCLLVLLRRYRSPAEFFSVVSLGVMSIYFGFADRLLLPVYALLFCGAAEVLRDFGTRWIGLQRSQVLVAVLLLVAIGVDFEPRARWEEIRKAHDEFVQVENDLTPWITPDTRLATLIGHHYMVYLDRPVVSLEFALRRERRNSAVEAIIDKYDVNTVFIATGIRNESIRDYLRDRYGSGQSTGSATLWRVRD